MITPIKLIILDRDGVINQDSPNYICSADAWIPLPGSLSAIAKLTARGYALAVATNQSGIARGYFSEKDLNQIHQRMHQAITSTGGCVSWVSYCPHGPQAGCQCRKPQPGLLQACMQHFEVKPNQTLMIGDTWKDLIAAQQAGCEFALVNTGYEPANSHPAIRNWSKQHSNTVFEDLLQVAEQHHLLQATLPSTSHDLT